MTNDYLPIQQTGVQGGYSRCVIDTTRFSGVELQLRPNPTLSQLLVDTTRFSGVELQLPPNRYKEKAEIETPRY